MAKRGPKMRFSGAGKRHQFDDAFLAAMAADLAKRKATAALTVVDDVQTGLRAIVRGPAGSVSFHVSFVLDTGKGRENERPYQKIGAAAPELNVAKAREVAGIVRALGAKGIDIRKGPRPDRLIAELLEWREQWRPDITGPRETALPMDVATADFQALSGTLNPHGALILEDTACPGLRVVLRAGAAPRFRVGKVTLGTYPEVSVKEARKRAAPVVQILGQTGVAIEDD